MGRAVFRVGIAWDALGSVLPKVAAIRQVLAQNWAHNVAMWRIVTWTCAMDANPKHSSLMPRLPMTRMIKLIHDHSDFPSAAALGRAIGEPNLTRKLSRVRTDRLLPSPELLEKIAAHLDPVGRRMLIVTMADDAMLPGYQTDTDDPFQRLRITLRGLSDADLALVTELVRRLADPPIPDDPDDQS